MSAAPKSTIFVFVVIGGGDVSVTIVLPWIIVVVVAVVNVVPRGH